MEGVEWRLLLTNEGRLIQLLCALLGHDSDVQVEVSECLLNILARKVVCGGGELKMWGRSLIRSDWYNSGTKL